MKISLFSFVIFWVTEFSAYVCTEVDENDFGQDFSTEFSEKLCASLNSMTNQEHESCPQCLFLNKGEGHGQTRNIIHRLTS